MSEHPSLKDAAETKNKILNSVFGNCEHGICPELLEQNHQNCPILVKWCSSCEDFRNEEKTNIAGALAVTVSSPIPPG